MVLHARLHGLTDVKSCSRRCITHVTKTSCRACIPSTLKLHHVRPCSIVTHVSGKLHVIYHLPLMSEVTHVRSCNIPSTTDVT